MNMDMDMDVDMDVDMRVDMRMEQDIKVGTSTSAAVAPPLKDFEHQALFIKDIDALYVNLSCTDAADCPENLLCYSMNLPWWSSRFGLPQSDSSSSQTGCLCNTEYGHTGRECENLGRAGLLVTITVLTLLVVLFSWIRSLYTVFKIRSSKHSYKTDTFRTLLLTSSTLFFLFIWRVLHLVCLSDPKSRDVPQLGQPEAKWCLVSLPGLGFTLITLVLMPFAITNCSLTWLWVARRASGAGRSGVSRMRGPYDQSLTRRAVYLICVLFDILTLVAGLLGYWWLVGLIAVPFMILLIVLNVWGAIQISKVIVLTASPGSPGQGHLRPTNLSSEHGHLIHLIESRNAAIRQHNNQNDQRSRASKFCSLLYSYITICCASLGIFYDSYAAEFQGFLHHSEDGDEAEQEQEEQDEEEEEEGNGEGERDGDAERGGKRTGGGGENNDEGFPADRGSGDQSNREKPEEDVNDNSNKVSRHPVSSRRHFTTSPRHPPPLPRTPSFSPSPSPSPSSPSSKEESDLANPPNNYFSPRFEKHGAIQQQNARHSSSRNAGVDGVSGTPLGYSIGSNYIGKSKLAKAAIQGESGIESKHKELKKEVVDRNDYDDGMNNNRNASQKHIIENRWHQQDEDAFTRFHDKHLRSDSAVEGTSASSDSSGREADSKESLLDRLPRTAKGSRDTDSMTTSNSPETSEHPLLTSSNKTGEDDDITEETEVLHDDGPAVVHKMLFRDGVGDTDEEENYETKSKDNYTSECEHDDDSADTSDVQHAKKKDDLNFTGSEIPWKGTTRNVRSSSSSNSISSSNKIGNCGWNEDSDVHVHAHAHVESVSSRGGEEVEILEGGSQSMNERRKRRRRRSTSAPNLPPTMEEPEPYHAPETDSYIVLDAASRENSRSESLDNSSTRFLRSDTHTSDNQPFPERFSLDNDTDSGSPRKTPTHRINAVERTKGTGKQQQEEDEEKEGDDDEERASPSNSPREKVPKHLEKERKRTESSPLSPSSPLLSRLFARNVFKRSPSEQSSSSSNNNSSSGNKAPSKCSHLPDKKKEEEVMEGESNKDEYKEEMLPEEAQTAGSEVETGGLSIEKSSLEKWDSTTTSSQLPSEQQPDDDGNNESINNGSTTKEKRISQDKRKSIESRLIKDMTKDGSVVTSASRSSKVVRGSPKQNFSRKSSLLLEGQHATPRRMPPKIRRNQSDSLYDDHTRKTQWGSSVSALPLGSHEAKRNRRSMPRGNSAESDALSGNNAYRTGRRAASSSFRKSSSSRHARSFSHCSDVDRIWRSERYARSTDSSFATVKSMTNRISNMRVTSLRSLAADERDDNDVRSYKSASLIRVVAARVALCLTAALIAATVFGITSLIGPQKFAPPTSAPATPSALEFFLFFMALALAAIESYLFYGVYHVQFQAKKDNDANAGAAAVDGSEFRDTVEEDKDQDKNGDRDGDKDRENAYGDVESQYRKPPQRGHAGAMSRDNPHRENIDKSSSSRNNNARNAPMETGSLVNT